MVRLGSTKQSCTSDNLTFSAAHFHFERYNCTSRQKLVINCTSKYALGLPGVHRNSGMTWRARSVSLEWSLGHLDLVLGSI